MKGYLFFIVIGLSVLCGGCKTTDNNDRPIVSPEKISTEASGNSEPSIPYYKPIWEK